MAEDVLRDGIKILQPTASNDSVARAIKFIETSLFNALWKSQNSAA
jgi:hypothetical protein